MRKKSRRRRKRRVKNENKRSNTISNMYVYMSCLLDIQWRRAFFPLSLSLFITCLSICKSDKANEWKLMECKSCPRRMGNVTFFCFFVLSLNSGCLSCTRHSSFSLHDGPDFSFIHIIDIVTHNRTPIVFTTTNHRELVRCDSFSTCLIAENSLLILLLIICSNKRIHYKQQLQLEHLSMCTI